jgi:hypothetical protein
MNNLFFKNKIYGCGKTSIVTGFSYLDKEEIDQLITAPDSPIRKYFTTQKILWTFDDYFMEIDHHPPHKGFGGLTEKINDYGGHVSLMVVFTDEYFTAPYNNEIRNYSVVNEFGWSQDKINKSLEFFSRDKVYPQCHGWNYSSEDLNNANLSYAYKLINHTLWNWENNYNIKPNFFLGASVSGNYNITLALKNFSDNYWNVYGERFRWGNSSLFPNLSRGAPAIEYIGKADYVGMVDPLFGQLWGTPSKTLAEAKDLFNIQTKDKEVILVIGHPNILNGTDQRAIENLSLWEDWIDWIYQEHNLININHTEAIYYNVDRYNFRVQKHGMDNFTIDLTRCKYNHNVLFTNPYGDPDRIWILHDEDDKYIGKTPNDVFLYLESGKKYYFKTN